MKKLMVLLLGILWWLPLSAQTQLTEAVDFHVKDIEGNIIDLFPILDEANQIVVIDFFSTS